MVAQSLPSQGRVAEGRERFLPGERPSPPAPPFGPLPLRALVARFEAVASRTSPLKGRGARGRVYIRHWPSNHQGADTRDVRLEACFWVLVLPSLLGEGARGRGRPP